MEQEKIIIIYRLNDNGMELHSFSSEVELEKYVRNKLRLTDRQVRTLLEMDEIQTSKYTVCVWTRSYLEKVQNLNGKKYDLIVH